MKPRHRFQHCYEAKVQNPALLLTVTKPSSAMSEIKKPPIATSKITGIRTIVDAYDVANVLEGFVQKKEVI